MEEDLPSWAFVGNKVVCINDGPFDGRQWGGDAPVAGQTYTVSEVFLGGRSNASWCFEFEELKRNPQTVKAFRVMFGIRVGYWVRRFKPLRTAKADMAEHFVKLLDVPVDSDKEVA